MRRYIFVCVLFVAFVGNGIAQNYVVKTIYFKPTDAFDTSDNLNLDNMLNSIQSVYHSEMDRHGYPGQTFTLETDDAGDVIVHKINGKHAKAHYTADTIETVIKELPNQFQSPLKNIHIVIVAGMHSLMSGQVGGIAKTIAYGGWFDDGRYGGYAFASENPTANLEQVITHELGHVFGLWHIVLYDAAEYILGSGKKLAEHEARWLNRTHYFNKKREFSVAPKVVNFHSPIALNDDDIIRFRVDVNDSEGTYQIYAFKYTNLLGWDYLSGNNPTAEIDIHRRYLGKDNYLWLQIMDADGNWFWYYHTFVLPEPKGVKGIDEMTDKNPDLDLEVDQCKDCIVDQEEIVDIDETDGFISITPAEKLTILWAKVKNYNR